MTRWPTEPGTADEGTYVLLHIRLPDRPGALGNVASRIGAMRGDIIGVAVLDRSDDSAVDQLTVCLPDPDLLPMLVREIEEVDGVNVEAARLIAFAHDPSRESLMLATMLLEAQTVPELQRLFTRGLLRRFLAEWALLVCHSTIAASAGYPPALDTLAEPLPAGSRTDDEEPPNLARGILSRHDAEVLVGRIDPFFHRERESLRILSRIVDTAWNHLEHIDA